MLRPLLLVALVTALAACSSPTPVTNPTPTQPELAMCPSNIVIRDFEYLPGNCQVAAGTTIAFLNQDTVQHTATSLAGTPVAFDTGTINPKKSATVTFTAPGVYDYYCTIHPDMAASITVK